MAIITKPAGGILKGVPATITLNKSELASLPSVSADSYFSITSNWNKVILSYKSLTGNQQEIVEFDATLASPTGFFDVSLKARNGFNIQVLKIVDFDGDIFTVPRSQLNTADFDVEFVNPPSSLSYTTPVIYTQNQAITNNVPSVTGTVSSYSILPALPTGLSINPTTGVISGTPTALSTATNYTVTASNAGGSTTATINITVEEESTENYSYATYSYGNGHVFNSLGGVSGGDNLPVLSKNGKTEDFTMNFLLNLNSYQFPLSNNNGVCVGVSEVDVVREPNLPNPFTGFVIGGGAVNPNQFGIFVRNGLGVSFPISNIPSGDNLFQIKRTNDDFEFLLNGTIIHTQNDVKPRNFEVFPTVQVMGVVEVLESYFTEPIDNRYYFSDYYKASNLVVSNQGSTLEISQVLDYGCALVVAPFVGANTKNYYFEFKVDNKILNSQMSFGLVATYPFSAEVSPSDLSDPLTFLGKDYSSTNLQFYYKDGYMRFGNDGNTFAPMEINTGDNIGVLWEAGSYQINTKVKIIKNGTQVGSYNYAPRFQQHTYFAVQLASVGDKVTINNEPVYTLPSNTVYMKPKTATAPSNLVDFDGRTNASYISFPEPGSVVRLLPSQNEAALSRFWYTQAITDDFTFTATIKAGSVSDGICQALFGINDTVPPNNTPRALSYALKNEGWGINFYDGGMVSPWDVTSTQSNWSKGSTYEIEIKRVSGVVSYKVGATTFSYTLSTSATVYIVGCLQVGSWEVSNAQLVIPEVPVVESYTFSPDLIPSTGIALSNNNRTATNTIASGYPSVPIVTPISTSSGRKVYAEFTVDVVNLSTTIAWGAFFRNSTPSASDLNNNSVTMPGGQPSSANNRIVYQGGTIYSNMGASVSFGTLTNGTVVGLGIDFSAKTAFVTKDGVKVGNDFDITATIGSASLAYIGVGPQQVGEQFTINSTPTYTLPTGYEYIGPSIQPDYITYNLDGYTTPATKTAEGGVSGGIYTANSDVAVKSSIDTATGDFNYEWKFDWSGAANISNMFIGVTGNDIVNGISFYPNLTCLYGSGNNPDTAYLWHNGSQISGNINLLSGENIYRLKRVGSTITHYFNGVQVYSSTSTSFTAYPTVRTMGNEACIQSYIVL